MQTKNPAHNSGAGFGLSGGQADFTSSTRLTHAPTRRPQPPYAHTARRRLSEYMRNKVAGFGTLFVHAGRDAWDWKIDPRAALLSPEDQNPALLDWSVCKLATGPVLVINRNASQAHLEATARACLRDGAHKVLFVGLKDAPGIPMWEAAP